MTVAPEHLLIAPILLPLVAGALMLFYEDRRAKRVISLVAAGVLPIIAFALLDRAEAPSTISRQLSGAPCGLTW